MVVAFYQFVPIDDLESLQQDIRRICKNSSMLGTILLAHEGINGTVAGAADELETLFEFLNQNLKIQGLNSTSVH